jgi:hypothetical protein
MVSVREIVRPAHPCFSNSSLIPMVYSGDAGGKVEAWMMSWKGTDSGAFSG